MSCKAARALADQIRRSVGEDAWHGPSVIEALEGVTAAHAAWRPPGGGHSIAEIVAHIYFWHWDLLAVVRGRAYRANRELSQWPGVRLADDQSWRKLVGTIRDKNAELAAAVEVLNPDALARPMENRPYDLEFALHGLTQHNAYHAGQIALLRKMAAVAAPG
jgi:hypothetical protein